MSKVCKNCGYQLQDDALFCFSCGTKIEDEVKPEVQDFNSFAQPVQPESVAPVANEEANIPFANAETNPDADNGYNFGYNTQVVENQPQVEPQPVQPAEKKEPKPKKRKSFWIKLIAFFVVLAVIAAGVVLYVVDDINCKNVINKAVDKYIDAVYLGETDLIEDMMPEDYEDVLSDQFDDWEIDPDEVFESRSANMDEVYGDDITIKYEITDFERVPCFNYYYYIDMLEINHPIQLDDIDTIYRIRFDITIKGSEGNDVISNKMAAIEIDDKWYLVNLNSYYFAYADSIAQNLAIDPEYDDYYGEDYY